MYTERRSQGRIPIKFAAHCTKGWNKDYSTNDFFSFVKDLSPEGARLVVPREINAGSSFITRLEMPSYFIPLMAYSRVMWARQLDIIRSGSRKTMELGIRFIYMDSFDRHRLNEFLSEHLNASVGYFQEA